MRTPNRIKSHLTSTADGFGNTNSSVWTNHMNGNNSLRKGKSNRANSNAYGLYQPILGGQPGDSIE